MRYRKLSPDGDYTFGSGQSDFYRDTPEAVSQAVKTRLMLWLGEWFLDVEDGTPYLQGVIGKNEDQVTETVFRTRILETQGVLAITNYESTLDRDTRKFSLSVSISTIYGDTIVEATV